MITDFSTKKKRTSNQEGGPRVLRGRLLIIHPLPNVTGSAADRSTFFLLNGVVGDGPRENSTSTYAEPGGMTANLLRKNEPQIKTSNLGCLGADFRSFIPCRMWLAAPRMDQLCFCSTA